MIWHLENCSNTTARNLFLWGEITSHLWWPLVWNSIILELVPWPHWFLNMGLLGFFSFSPSSSVTIWNINYRRCRGGSHEWQNCNGRFLKFKDQYQYHSYRKIHTQNVILNMSPSEINHTVTLIFSQNFNPEIVWTYYKSNSACEHDHGNPAQNNFNCVLFCPLRTSLDPER